MNPTKIQKLVQQIPCSGFLQSNRKERKGEKVVKWKSVNVKKVKSKNVNSLRRVNKKNGLNGSIEKMNKLNTVNK